MPSAADLPPNRPSICILGDSHIASVKRAIDEGLLDFGSAHVEFWGATGPEFRKIRLKGNVLRPITETARQKILQLNGHGRDQLDSTEFDALLFYGARLRLSEYLPPLLDIICRPDGHISTAVSETATRNYCDGTRAYRTARQLAKTRQDKTVWFAPASLLTKGVGVQPDLLEFASAAGEAERDIVRGWLDRRAEADGVQLLHQPEDTIVDGYLTDPKHAVSADDEVHKSPEFAALMVEPFVDHVLRASTAVAGKVA